MTSKQLNTEGLRKLSREIKRKYSDSQTRMKRRRTHLCVRTGYTLPSRTGRHEHDVKLRCAVNPSRKRVAKDNRPTKRENKSNCTKYKYVCLLQKVTLIALV